MAEDLNRSCSVGVKTAEKAFHLTNEKMGEIRDNLTKEMIEGLGLNSKSSLAMIPSYISSLPTGKEKGSAYALDIGGSNLRVLRVDLDGNGGITTNVQLKKEIPVGIQRGARDDLFDFIATAVEEVVTEGKLGFTFSFPLDQKSLASGFLLKWTKGFNAANCIGEDVCKILSDRLVNKGLKISVNALINDTVGTQLSGAYQSGGLFCPVALILGTGSNTCYYEEAKNVPKWDAKGASHVIINMESGNYGARNRGVDLPMNEYDLILDDQSINPGHQLLEKQISGMYLGELCRLVLRKETAAGTCFKKFPDSFNVPYGFETADVSILEADSTETLEAVSQILIKHGVLESTHRERKFVQEIGHAIGERSAYLAAIQIGAILKHIGRDNEPLAVAVDGSVFAKFPLYKDMMDAGLKILLGHNKVHLFLAGEGSGYGAALASFLN